MKDVQDRPSSDFRDVAAATPPRKPITIEIDADVLDWMEQEGVNLLSEVNGYLRFMKDTTVQKEAEFAPDAWEPGEMQAPGL